jgi:hypothetical protein
MMVILRARRVWESITEPRHLKATYFVFYGVALLTGFVTLLRPPQSIEGALGGPLTAVWAGFVIMGAFGGLLTVFPGWWFAERLSIVMIWLGAAIYFIVVLSLQLSQSGSRLTQMGWIALGAGLFFVRWLLIRKYTFEPRR